MLKVANFKGRRNKLGVETERKIIKWFEENPDTTQAECSRGTGFSRATVSRYVNDILKEQALNGVLR